MTRARIFARATFAAVVVALAVALILAPVAALVALLAVPAIAAGYVALVVLTAVLVFLGSIESTRPPTMPAPARGDEEKPEPDEPE